MRVFVKYDGVDIKVGCLGKRLLIWNKFLLEWMGINCGGFFGV